jgi:uncharacterized membrane protein YgcG
VFFYIFCTKKIMYVYSCQMNTKILYIIYGVLTAIFAALSAVMFGRFLWLFSGALALENTANNAVSAGLGGSFSMLFVVIFLCSTLYFGSQALSCILTLRRHRSPRLDEADFAVFIRSASISLIFLLCLLPATLGATLLNVGFRTAITPIVAIFGAGSNLRQDSHSSTSWGATTSSGWYTQSSSSASTSTSFFSSGSGYSSGTSSSSFFGQSSTAASREPIYRYHSASSTSSSQNWYDAFPAPSTEVQTAPPFQVRYN